MEAVDESGPDEVVGDGARADKAGEQQARWRQELTGRRMAAGEAATGEAGDVWAMATGKAG